MTQYVFANNVNTTLAAAATSTDTTLTLGSSTNLPSLTTGQVMPLWLNDAATRSVYELVYVTGISGATLTVERGQEGTTAVSWAVGDYAYCGPTGGTVANVYGDSSNAFEVADSTSGTQEAVPRSQADSTYLTQTNAAADYAAINGSTSENFSVKAASATGQAVQWDQVLVGATRTNETANRAYATNYTNSGTRPMLISVSTTTSSTSSTIAYVVGSQSFTLQGPTISNAPYGIQFWVLPGETYKVTETSMGLITNWWETM